jgi:hypothetical protein
MTLMDVYAVNELKSLITTSMSYYITKIIANSEQFLQIQDGDNYNQGALLLNNINCLESLNKTIFEEVIIPSIDSRLSSIILPLSEYPSNIPNEPNRDEIIYENRKQLLILVDYYNQNSVK